MTGLVFQVPRLEEMDSRRVDRQVRTGREPQMFQNGSSEEDKRQTPQEEIPRPANQRDTGHLQETRRSKIRRIVSCL